MYLNKRVDLSLKHLSRRVTHASQHPTVSVMSAVPYSTSSASDIINFISKILLTRTDQLVMATGQMVKQLKLKMQQRIYNLFQYLQSYRKTVQMIKLVKMKIIMKLSLPNSECFKYRNYSTYNYFLDSG